MDPHLQTAVSLLIILSKARKFLTFEKNILKLLKVEFFDSRSKKLLLVHAYLSYAFGKIRLFTHIISLILFRNDNSDN